MSAIAQSGWASAAEGGLRSPDAQVRRLSETEILSRVREAFLQHGFDAISMGELAKAAGLSRRGFYYRYASKDAVYRSMIRWQNEESLIRGLEAGRLVRAEGGTPVDVFTEIMNIRFGVTRRMVESSPHAVELNAVAFAKCRDIAIDVAIRFQEDMASLIESLVDEDVLQLRRGFSAADIAQILAYGARGVNQALPPAPVDTLPKRYRQLCEAVLLGATIPVPRPRPTNRNIG